MAEPVIYLNGKMIPESQAGLKVYDAGIVLGATTTEMTRTFRQKLFRIKNHIDRLYQSLRYMDLDIGMTPPEMIGLSKEITAHNAALIMPNQELGLIHFV